MAVSKAREPGPSSESLSFPLDRLNFTSESFDPLAALAEPKLLPPCPRVRVFPNLDEYVKALRAGTNFEPIVKGPFIQRNTKGKGLPGKQTSRDVHKRKVQPQSSKEGSDRLEVGKQSYTPTTGERKKVKVDRIPSEKTVVLDAVQTSGLSNKESATETLLPPGALKGNEPKKSKQQMLRERRERLQALMISELECSKGTGPRQYPNIIDKMNAMKKGPFSVLYNCMVKGLKLKVWTRRYKGIRGVCCGYLVAFDKHMNLAMIDVDEVYTLETRTLDQIVDTECSKRKSKKKKKKKTAPEMTDNSIKCAADKETVDIDDSIDLLMNKPLLKIEISEMKYSNAEEDQNSNTKFLQDADTITNVEEETSGKSHSEEEATSADVRGVVHTNSCSFENTALRSTLSEECSKQVENTCKASFQQQELKTLHDDEILDSTLKSALNVIESDTEKSVTKLPPRLAPLEPESSKMDISIESNSSENAANEFGASVAPTVLSLSYDTVCHAESPDLAHLPEVTAQDICQNDYSLETSKTSVITPPCFDIHSIGKPNAADGTIPSIENSPPHFESDFVIGGSSSQTIPLLSPKSLGSPEPSLERIPSYSDKISIKDTEHQPSSGEDENQLNALPPVGLDIVCTSSTVSNQEQNNNSQEVLKTNQSSNINAPLSTNRIPIISNVPLGTEDSEGESKNIESLDIVHPSSTEGQNSILSLGKVTLEGGKRTVNIEGIEKSTEKLVEFVDQTTGQLQSIVVVGEAIPLDHSGIFDVDEQVTETKVTSLYAKDEGIVSEKGIDRHPEPCCLENKVDTTQIFDIQSNANVVVEGQMLDVSGQMTLISHDNLVFELGEAIPLDIADHESAEDVVANLNIDALRDYQRDGALPKLTEVHESSPSLKKTPDNLKLNECSGDSVKVGITGEELMKSRQIPPPLKSDEALNSKIAQDLQITDRQMNLDMVSQSDCVMYEFNEESQFESDEEAVTIVVDESVVLDTGEDGTITFVVEGCYESEQESNDRSPTVSETEFCDESSAKFQVKPGTDMIQVKQDTDVIKVKQDTDMIQVKRDTDMIQVKQDTDMVQVKQDIDMIQIKQDTDMIQVKQDTDMIQVKPGTVMIQVKQDTDVTQVKQDTDTIQVKLDTDVTQVKQDTDTIQVKLDTDMIQVKPSTDMIQVKQSIDMIQVKQNTDMPEVVDDISNRIPGLPFLVTLENSEDNKEQVAGNSPELNPERTLPSTQNIQKFDDRSQDTTFVGSSDRRHGDDKSMTLDNDLTSRISYINNSYEEIPGIVNMKTITDDSIQDNLVQDIDMNETDQYVEAFSRKSNENDLNKEETYQSTFTEEHNSIEPLRQSFGPKLGSERDCASVDIVNNSSTDSDNNGNVHAYSNTEKHTKEMAITEGELASYSDRPVQRRDTNHDNYIFREENIAQLAPLTRVDLPDDKDISDCIKSLPSGTSETTEREPSCNFDESQELIDTDRHVVVSSEHENIDLRKDFSDPSSYSAKSLENNTNQKDKTGYSRPSPLKTWSDTALDHVQHGPRVCEDTTAGHIDENSRVSSELPRLQLSLTETSNDESEHSSGKEAREAFKCSPETPGSLQKAEASLDEDEHDCISSEQEINSDVKPLSGGLKMHTCPSVSPNSAETEVVEELKKATVVIVPPTNNVTASSSAKTVERTSLISAMKSSATPKSKTIICDIDEFLDDELDYDEDDPYEDVSQSSMSASNLVADLSQESSADNNHDSDLRSEDEGSSTPQTASADNNNVNLDKNDVNREIKREESLSEGELTSDTDIEGLDITVRNDETLVTPGPQIELLKNDLSFPVFSPREEKNIWFVKENPEGTLAEVSRASTFLPTEEMTSSKEHSINSLTSKGSRAKDDVKRENETKTIVKKRGRGTFKFQKNGCDVSSTEKYKADKDEKGSKLAEPGSIRSRKESCSKRHSDAYLTDSDKQYQTRLSTNIETGGRKEKRITKDSKGDQMYEHMSSQRTEKVDRDSKSRTRRSQDRSLSADRDERELSLSVTSSSDNSLNNFHSDDEKDTRKRRSKGQVPLRETKSLEHLPRRHDLKDKFSKRKGKRSGDCSNDDVPLSPAETSRILDGNRNDKTKNQLEKDKSLTLSGTSQLKTSKTSQSISDSSAALSKRRLIKPTNATADDSCKGKSSSKKGKVATTSSFTGDGADRLSSSKKEKEPKGSSTSGLKQSLSSASRISDSKLSQKVDCDKAHNANLEEYKKKPKEEKVDKGSKVATSESICNESESCSELDLNKEKRKKKKKKLCRSRSNSIETSSSRSSSKAIREEGRHSRASKERKSDRIVEEDHERTKESRSRSDTRSSSRTSQRLNTRSRSHSRSSSLSVDSSISSSTDRQISKSSEIISDTTFADRLKKKKTKKSKEKEHHRSENKGLSKARTSKADCSVLARSEGHTDVHRTERNDSKEDRKYKNSRQKQDKEGSSKREHSDRDQNRADEDLKPSRHSSRSKAKVLSGYCSTSSVTSESGRKEHSTEKSKESYKMKDRDVKTKEKSSTKPRKDKLKTPLKSIFVPSTEEFRDDFIETKKNPLHVSDSKSNFDQWKEKATDSDFKTDSTIDQYSYPGGPLGVSSQPRSKDGSLRIQEVNDTRASMDNESPINDKKQASEIHGDRKGDDKSSKSKVVGKDFQLMQLGSSENSHAGKKKEQREEREEIEKDSLSDTTSDKAVDYTKEINSKSSKQCKESSNRKHVTHCKEMKGEERVKSIGDAPGKKSRVEVNVDSSKSKNIDMDSTVDKEALKREKHSDETKSDKRGKSYTSKHQRSSPMTTSGVSNSRSFQRDRDHSSSESLSSRDEVMKSQKGNRTAKTSATMQVTSETNPRVVPEDRASNSKRLNKSDAFDGRTGRQKEVSQSSINKRDSRESSRTSKSDKDSNKDDKAGRKQRNTELCASSGDEEDRGHRKVGRSSSRDTKGVASKTDIPDRRKNDSEDLTVKESASRCESASRSQKEKKSKSKISKEETKDVSDKKQSDRTESGRGQDKNDARRKSEKDKGEGNRSADEKRSKSDRKEGSTVHRKDKDVQLRKQRSLAQDSCSPTSEGKTTLAKIRESPRKHSADDNKRQSSNTKRETTAPASSSKRDKAVNSKEKSSTSSAYREDSTSRTRTDKLREVRDTSVKEGAVSARSRSDRRSRGDSKVFKDDVECILSPMGESTGRGIKLDGETVKRSAKSTSSKEAKSDDIKAGITASRTVSPKSSATVNCDDKRVEKSKTNDRASEDVRRKKDAKISTTTRKDAYKEGKKLVKSREGLNQEANDDRKPEERKFDSSSDKETSQRLGDKKCKSFNPDSSTVHLRKEETLLDSKGNPRQRLENRDKPKTREERTTLTSTKESSQNITSKTEVSRKGKSESPRRGREPFVRRQTSKGSDSSYNEDFVKGRQSLSPASESLSDKSYREKHPSKRKREDVPSEVSSSKRARPTQIEGLYNASDDKVGCGETVKDNQSDKLNLKGVGHETSKVKTVILNEKVNTVPIIEGKGIYKTADTETKACQSITNATKVNVENSRQSNVSVVNRTSQANVTGLEFPKKRPKTKYAESPLLSLYLPLSTSRKMKSIQTDAGKNLPRTATTFEPFRPLQGHIFRRRHVNQLFIRGDNVVMVACDSL